MKSLQEVIARLESRQEVVSVKGKPIPTANQLSLFHTSDTYTPTPNALIRSALFGVLNLRAKRQYLERQELISYGDVQVTQTGPQLSQDDFDVWAQCVKVAVEAANLPKVHGGPIPPDEPIRFHITPFVKALGKIPNGSNIETVDKTLERLSSVVIRVKQGRQTVFGPLIQRGAKDEETGLYSLLINPDFRAIFTDRDTITFIDTEQRKGIKGQLARWMHSFYSTHKEPYPLKLQTLRDLSGSTTKAIRNFRQDTKQALQELARATGWVCSLEDDLVHITKPKQLRK